MQRDSAETRSFIGSQEGWDKAPPRALRPANPGKTVRIEAKVRKSL